MTPETPETPPETPETLARRLDHLDGLLHSLLAGQQEIGKLTADTRTDIIDLHALARRAAPLLDRYTGLADRVRTLTGGNRGRRHA
jgi:hypothetical protein